MSRFVGIDLGGTKVAAAAVDDDLNATASSTVKTPTDTDALVGQLVASIEEVRSDDTEAVGIGVPSVVELATGTVLASTNIPLFDVPLRELLEDRVGLPVFVDNDASVAALAEAHDDDGELQIPNLVMLTVGTGVGGGIVQGGRLLRSSRTGGSHLGHIPIGLDLRDGAPMEDPEDKPPLRGTVEDLAAGRALDRLARDIARREPQGPLGELERQGEPVDGKALLHAAQDGDKAALNALRIVGERLGVAIALVTNIFDPDAVVLGGGAASAAKDLLLDPARRIAKRYTIPGLGTRTTIGLARRGGEAGVLGAALMARQELDRPRQEPAPA